MAVILDIMRRCCFCNTLLPAGDSGNNPEPLRHSGRCCDRCNLIYVTAAKLLLAQSPNADEQEQAEIVEAVNRCVNEDMRNRTHDTIT